MAKEEKTEKKKEKKETLIKRNKCKILRKNINQKLYHYIVAKICDCDIYPLSIVKFSILSSR